MNTMFAQGLLDKEKFNSSGADQRASILQGANMLYGDKLKFFVEESLERISETSDSTLFRGTGVFKDEDELEEMFKGKPKILAAIYRNAKTIDCKITERKLWELPNYTTIHDHKEETKEIRKRKVYNESTQGAPKKPKEPKQPKTKESAEPSDRKPLTASETKRLNAAVAKVSSQRQREREGGPIYGPRFRAKFEPRVRPKVSSQHIYAEREREREREKQTQRERERERENYIYICIYIDRERERERERGVRNL